MSMRIDRAAVAKEAKLDGKFRLRTSEESLTERFSRRRPMLIRSSSTLTITRLPTGPDASPPPRQPDRRHATQLPIAHRSGPGAAGVWASERPTEDRTVRNLGLAQRYRLVRPGEAHPAGHWTPTARGEGMGVGRRSRGRLSALGRRPTRSGSVTALATGGFTRRGSSGSVCADTRARGNGAIRRRLRGCSLRRRPTLAERSRALRGTARGRGDRAPGETWRPPPERVGTSAVADCR